jgi:hypothetical protein
MNEMSKETAEELKERINAVVDSCKKNNVWICSPEFVAEKINRIIDQYVLR